MQMVHCNVSYSNTSHNHDDVFNQVANYNAVHAAENGIKHCKQSENDSIKMSNIIRSNMKWNIRLHIAPRHKNFYKFSKADKAIRQEAKATNERKYHGDIMRS